MKRFKSLKYALVGEESSSNLRLSQILKEAYGKENVARFLELHQLEPFLAANQESPIVVCLDLLGFNLQKATEMVGITRDTYPKVVFNLYVDQDEYHRRSQDLPDPWQERFSHYFKTFKEDADVEYEPIVRGSLLPSQQEALFNMDHEPVRLTPVFNKGVVHTEAPSEDAPESPFVFISYSRADWEPFVSGLVSGLSKESCKIWIDQDYIVGGDDWMDAIGEAL